MKEDAFVPGKKVDERTDRGTAGVQDQPNHEQHESQGARTPPAPQGCSNADGKQQRKDRKTAVIKKITRDDPAEDRRGAKRVVLVPFEERRDVKIRRTSEERQPFV